MPFTPEDCPHILYKMWETAQYNQKRVGNVISVSGFDLHMAYMTALNDDSFRLAVVEKLPIVTNRSELHIGMGGAIYFGVLKGAKYGGGPDYIGIAHRDQDKLSEIAAAIRLPVTAEV